MVPIITDEPGLLIIPLATARIKNAKTASIIDEWEILFPYRIPPPATSLIPQREPKNNTHIQPLVPFIYSLLISIYDLFF
jgi:hypothetical protein